MPSPNNASLASLVKSNEEIEAEPAISFRIAILTLLVVISAYIYVRRRSQKKFEEALEEQHNCKPVLARLPYRWPLALDLVKRHYDVLFSDHTFEQLTEFFDIAPTGRVDMFGAKGYFTTDPENIETILSIRFEDYGLGSRRLASFPLIGEGIFGQDGPAWKRSRELIRRQFVRVQKQSLQVFTPLVKELVMSLSEAAVGAEIVDMKPLFFEYTLNTTTNLLFGEPHSSLPKDKRDAVRENFDYAAFGCGIRVRLADLGWLYNPTKFRNACKAVRDWATFFAKKAMEHKDQVGEEKASEKYSFIIDLWKEMRDEELVRDQLLNILIAGRDSTASLLSWTFFHLIRNQEVLERLKREVCSIPIDSDITREQIQKLPFLRCCLNETLRLYPSLPLNIRFATKNTVLPRGGGTDGQSPMLMLKGGGIAWSVYHLHRLESIYGPDSRVYRPQRWENGELIKKARLGFIDFHAGPRACLGKDFALMEASYAIIRILQAFPDIRLPPGVPNEPVGAERHIYTISLEPTDGVKVLLT